VDKEACAREGVLVMNDPISNGRSVVEMVFGQMICLARRIFDANDQSHHNIWTKDNKLRFELKGKTLGVLGLGNIGKQVAQMGELFGMNVVFWDDREVAREVGAALGWRCCPTALELFRHADVVSVHVSAENWRGLSNRDLLKYEHFAALGEQRPQPSPRIFINAARGFLYDPEHLKQALREGKVLSAAVDVFPVEPGGKLDAWENPYAEFAQVVTTPHIGAATLEAQPRIAAYVASTTRQFDELGKVRSCVYAPGQSIGVDTDGAKHVLTVVHSDKRGTKKAISDSIFAAGLNNLESSHRDFSKYGIAYDVSAMDQPLSDEQIEGLIEAARRISNDPTAIRAIRQVALGQGR
jgi:D-3-phosphoglycerate dehydrogenase